MPHHESEMRQNALKTPAKLLALTATFGMFLVLVMGSTVTNTGSEHGCGRSWPLCHGKLIPQFAVQTFIEFSHRAVVGVESVLIIALAIAVLWLHWDRTEARVLAPLMVVFLFLQAGLGAWAVMAPQSSAALALHFGVSLVAFAGVLLTTVFLFEVEGGERLRDNQIPGPYRRFVWGLTAYMYFVVYLGAYVRHTHADLACAGWPLCNGLATPDLGSMAATNYVHRLAAGLLIVGVGALVAWTRPLGAQRPDLWRGSAAALAFVILQALSGAAVVLSRVDLFSALSHAALVALLFGSLSYLCVHVLPRRSRRVEPPAQEAPTSRSEPQRDPALVVRFDARDR